MADIFVSYAREDRPAVVELVRLLGERTWSVWWDRQIIAGAEFDLVIDKELSAARCAIVVWSQHSVASRWVRNEAADAMERGVLIPIRLDDARIPLPFRSLETIAMVDWPNRARNTELRALFHSIAEVLSHRESGPAKPAQPTSNFEPSLSFRVAQRVLDAISPQRQPDSRLRIERLIADVALSIARRQDPPVRMAARLAAGLRDAVGAIGACFWHGNTLVHEDWSHDAGAEHRALARDGHTNHGEAVHLQRVAASSADGNISWVLTLSATAGTSILVAFGKTGEAAPGRDELDRLAVIRELLDLIERR